MSFLIVKPTEIMETELKNNIKNCIKELRTNIVSNLLLS